MRALDVLRFPADAVWFLKFRRERTRTLARFFPTLRSTEKTVALLGNGPSLARADTQAINRCERVVRFNYFPHDERRCTDWVLAMTSELAARLRDETLEARLKEMHTVWLFRPHSEKIAEKVEALFGDRATPRELVPARFIENARALLGGYPPSAGLILLVALPELFPDHAWRIAGMGDVRGDHYFNARHRPWWRHNLRRERAVIRYLLRAGALQSL